MPSPEPLVIPWRNGQMRVRHDDPHLSSDSSTGRQLRAAVNLASDVEGLRRVLETAMGRDYVIRLANDGSVVGLWRR